MRRDQVRWLIGLNIALLGVLAAVEFVPARTADAQAGATRARGEYTMVGARMLGGNSNAIVIMDANNQEMIALKWNEGQKSLEGIGFRDLSRDATAKIGPGRE